MAQPIRRTNAAVRAYAEQLRKLTDQVRDDPLNEVKAVALVAHIVNNRAAAAQLYRVLEDQSMGALC
jgi:hypothetical protein